MSVEEPTTDQLASQQIDLASDTNSGHILTNANELLTAEPDDSVQYREFPWLMEQSTPNHQDAMMRIVNSPYQPAIPRRSVCEPTGWHDPSDTVPVPLRTIEPQIIFHRGGRELGLGSERADKRRARRQSPYSRPQKPSRYPQEQTSTPVRPHQASSFTTTPPGSMPFGASITPDSRPFNQSSNGRICSSGIANKSAMLDPTLLNYQPANSMVQTDLVVHLGVQELKEIVIESVRLALRGRLDT